jgi:hypothetical protein
MDRNAFEVEVLKRSLEGIVVVDRRKSSDRLKHDDRPDQRTAMNSDEVDAAEPGQVFLSSDAGGDRSDRG